MDFWNIPLKIIFINIFYKLWDVIKVNNVMYVFELLKKEQNMEEQVYITC